MAGRVITTHVSLDGPPTDPRLFEAERGQIAEARVQELEAENARLKGALAKPAKKSGPPAVAAVMPIEDAYLPLRALVVYSGLSIRTLNKKFADLTHPLPFYTFSGKIHVRKSDFDAWAAPFRRTRGVNESLDGSE